MKLTLCMIAYNEEKTIVRALASAKDCIDKVIIGIDNKTNDKTFEVVHQWCYDNRIDFEHYRFEFDEDFGSARNLGLDIAEKDKREYVLILDADEYLHTKSVDNIKKVMFGIQQSKLEIESILVTQINYSNDRKIRNRVMSPRIFKPTTKYKYRTHEVPDIKTNKNAEVPDIVIYNKKIEGNIKRRRDTMGDKYEQAFLQDIKDYPEDALPRWNLASLLIDIGLEEKNKDILARAYKQFNRVLQDHPKFLNKYATKIRMAHIMYVLNNEEAFMKIMNEVIDEYGMKRAEHLVMLGMFYQQKGDMILSLKYLLTATNVPIPKTQEIVYIDDYLTKPWEYLFGLFSGMEKVDWLDAIEKQIEEIKK